MLNSMDRWKKFFAEGVRIAAEQDYLSDLLYYEMGGEKIADEDEAAYNKLWNEMHEAFQQIFGENYYGHFPYKSNAEEE